MKALGKKIVLGALAFTSLNAFAQKDVSKQRYKVAVVDLMILKRQKLGALPLTKEIGADGVEVDLGGLGNRPTFDNKLLIDSVRQQFLDKAKELNLDIDRKSV